MPARRIPRAVHAVAVELARARRRADRRARRRSVRSASGTHTRSTRRIGRVEQAELDGVACSEKSAKLTPLRPRLRRADTATPATHASATIMASDIWTQDIADRASRLSRSRRVLIDALWRAWHAETLRWLRWWADLLDSRFRIPGTHDPVRDRSAAVAHSWPGRSGESGVRRACCIAQGLHQRVPHVVLVRMVVNALLDACIGAIPIAGTVGDIFWRANTRNLALLERHARPGLAPRRRLCAAVVVSHCS